jgi:hypothetical protein
MKRIQVSRCLGLAAFLGFVFYGCVTRDGVEANSTSELVPSAAEANGQATTVTAEGEIKREQNCVPSAEKDRVEAPSVELGISRPIDANAQTQPYTRYNCR